LTIGGPRAGAGNSSNQRKPGSAPTGNCLDRPIAGAVEDDVSALPEPTVDLVEQLDTCLRELDTARHELVSYAAYCRSNDLLVEESLIAGLVDAVKHAVQSIAEKRLNVATRAEGALTEQLAAGEAVFRFGLATLAYARGALEWCSPSYAQSRAVQFFDIGAQDSPTVNYERYEHKPVARVEQQLFDMLGLQADHHALSATSSGVAAYSLIESFLLRARLRAGDTVLIAPYLYFEASEQLTSLPFIRVVRLPAYDLECVIAAVRRYRPRCIFADPITNTAQQRLIDLDALVRRLRSVVTERTTVVIDGTMLSGALPADWLVSDKKVEILYYESGSKYLQLGLDAGMAGMVVYPAGLRGQFERLRRNTGLILYRHGAELFPRYQRDSYQRRMRRIGANALRIATLLHNDPRVRDAGRIFYPLLADHPDTTIARKLPHAGGSVTFLFHAANRNNREELNGLMQRILVSSQESGVHLTKGASFGFSTPRVSAADAFAEGEPLFLRIYAGDRADQVEALAESIAQALVPSTTETVHHACAETGDHGYQQLVRAFD
jgi:cystathionine gamma-synthase